VVSNPPKFHGRPPDFFKWGGGQMKNDTSNGPISSIVGWWRHPFNSAGSAFTWIMFVGLLVIAAFLWQLVLIDFMKEV
jgi:hypothetical protein